jgi:tetratricopeptide (TPR) repeat protein
LAALLAYLAVENSMCDSWAMTTGMQALRGVPECYTICDSLGVRVGGVANLHRTTIGGAIILNRTLPERLAQMRNLPAAVKLDAERSAKAVQTEEGQLDPNWADPVGRRAVVADLVAAGAPDKDQNEPSWEFLGRMIEDVTLVHAYRRIEFLNDALGLPPDDVALQLQQAREIVADHPYAGLITFAAIRCRETDVVCKALLDVPLKDTDVPLYDVIKRAARLKTANAKLSQQAQEMLRKICSQRDEIACDVEYLVTVGQVGGFDRISPNSPLSAAAKLMMKESSFTPEQLKEQEFLGNRHPTWQRALGDRYFGMGDTESAARCYQKYLKLSPDQRGYYKLAEVYWANKDFAKWRETLEESLKAPDHGLTHAQTRVSIANYLMREGKFKEAEPYAMGAAETHAQWALMCAVKCYEGLEEWDKANEIFETAVRRYPGREFEWYNWCYITGHGDLKGASDLMLQLAPAMFKRAQALDLDLVGSFYLSSGRKGLARTTYRRFFERYKVPWAGLTAAVLAEDGRAPQERDKLIAEVIAVTSSPEAAAIPEVAPYLKLAQWLQKDCAKSKGQQPDLVSLDTILAPIDTPDFLQQTHIIVRHFQANGQKELAEKYLAKAEASPRKQKLLYVMLAKMRTGADAKANSVVDN